MSSKTYKRILHCFLMITTGVFFASCQGESKKEAVAVEAALHKEGEEEHEETLELNAEQMKSVGIEIGSIEQRNLSAVVKANGQLAVPPQNKAEMSVLSGGIVRKINVLEGQQVKRGQVLAFIENQELLQIQQDYLASKNNFSYIQAEYNRQTQLQEAGAGTGKNFQAAQASFNAERSKIKAYESQLSQLGISPGRISGGKLVSQLPLLSPISGTVGHITASTGAFVQPGTSILEVVDNSKIHCDITVFEKDLMKVRVGQKVNFTLTNQQDRVITGKINGINKSFENESKGVVVHAVIDNNTKKNLIPGMYVTALISVGTELSPSLPLDAVVQIEGKDYIFAVDDQDSGGKESGTLRFKKVEVKTGVSELGYIQVKPLEDLPANAKIVTKGAFYLQSAPSEEDED